MYKSIQKKGCSVPRGLRAGRDDWRLAPATFALAAARDLACANCSILSASARLGDLQKGGEGIKSRLTLMIAALEGLLGGLWDVCVPASCISDTDCCSHASTVVF